MSKTIDQLWQTILQRQKEMPDDSYTAFLFRKGENEIVKKIGEEAIEVIVAAKGETEDRIIYETADLFYHALVLLASRGLTWAQVEEELARRFK